MDVKYNIPLGSQSEAAVTLENYVKIFRQLGVRVHADINVPAYAFEEHVYVNRDQMYNFDLFTNFFVLFQLELSKKEHNFARKMNIFQNFLFFSSILVVVMGVILGESNQGLYLTYMGIGMQFFLFIFTVMGYTVYNKILNNSLDIASDLLDLDDVEYAQADQLKEDLMIHVFEYPLLILARVIKFVLPL